MADDGRDNAGVVAPPPLIFAVPLLLGLLLKRRFPIAFLPRRMTHALGWPLVGGGTLLVGWFEWAMRRAGTPTNPYKPVSRIAKDGPFRYTRNPAYLAMAMIFAGVSCLANSLPAILLLPVSLLTIQRGVIEREERYLEREFGEEYLRYKTQTRRWV